LLAILANWLMLFQALEGYHSIMLEKASIC